MSTLDNILSSSPQGDLSPVKWKTPQQEVPATPVKTVEPAKASMSYEEMYKKLDPFRPLSQEDIEKEKKKRKREMLFSAIGDGISALSNLYFTTKGAPNMFNAEKSASKQTESKWDKLRNEREAQMQAYIRNMMSARQADDAKAANERNWERQLGIDRYNMQKDAEALAYKKERDMADMENKFQDRKLKREQLEEAKRHNNATHALGRERNSIARIQANNSSADVNQFTAYDKHGNAHGFKTKEAADVFAKQNGTFQRTRIETTTTVNNGRKTQITKKTSSGKGYPVKPSPAKPTGVKNPNPINGKKKNPMS